MYGKWNCWNVACRLLGTDGNVLWWKSVVSKKIRTSVVFCLKQKKLTNEKNIDCRLVACLLRTVGLLGSRSAVLLSLSLFRKRLLELVQLSCLLGTKRGLSFASLRAYSDHSYLDCCYYYFDGTT